MMPGSNYNEHLENQYNCFGGTMNVYPQADKDQKSYGGVSYFDSPSFSESLQKLMKHMKENKNLHWSHVYQFLHKYRELGEMSAAAFGKFIERHGGPKEQTVRKDGDYQPTSWELKRDKPIIDSLSALFPIE